MATFIREWRRDEASDSPDGRERKASWTARKATFVNVDDVRNDPDFPVRINDPWIDDPSLSVRCDRISITPMGPRIWHVEAHWSTPDDGSQHTGSQTQEDPTETPVEVQVDDIVYMMSVDRDVDGNPIINAVGRPPETTPQKPFKAKRLTIYRNEQSYNAATALAFENSVNADAFQGAAPDEVQCLSITPTHTFTISAAYVRVGYSFEFRPIAIWGDEPHQLRFLHQDTVSYASVTVGEQTQTKLVQLATSSGPIDRPVLLTQAGIPVDSHVTYIDPQTGNPVASPTWVTQPVPDGARVVQGPGSDAVYYIYRIYPRLSFSSLGLPAVLL